MFKIPPKARRALRVLAVAMSTGLFGYLIWRTGPSKLWENVMTLGWGFTWVIALAGVSHLAKTWAWRLTLGEDKHKVSFPRMLGLRLGSEAAGQLGILGQTFGDSIRVSHLSPEIRTTSGVASVTLDRGLYIAFLLLTLLAVRKRWPVLSGSACIILRVPFLKSWMDKEYPLIQSVESTLFDFHHNLPKAFWTSFSLNLAGHCLAVLEVCLVLWLMKTKLGFVGALVVEAFTKIVNVVGNINPGNIGTYEGGNMLIGKMFGMNVATGLVLGLARRLRSLIWAAVGIICLFLLTRPRRRRDSEGRGSTAGSAPNNQRAQADPVRSFQSDGEAAVVILIANEGTNSSEFEAPLARVGTLPILLRTILAAQKLSPSRIVVVLDPVSRRRVQRDLFFTGRLPESVQWIETAAGTSLVEQLRLIATQSRSERLVLIEGNTTYHSSLLRKASECS